MEDALASALGSMRFSGSAPAASPPPDELLSPPRGWPASFHSAALNAFIGKGGLGGTRCRLTGAPTSEQRLQVLTAAERVSIAVDDSTRNAESARDALGWRVVKGFAVFELASAPGQYCALPRWWNATAEGAWVDLTPRAHTQLVLVESELGAPTARPSSPQARAAQPIIQTRKPLPAASLAMLQSEGAALTWEELSRDVDFRSEVAELHNSEQLYTYLAHLRAADPQKLRTIQRHSAEFTALLANS